jgi:hypothetical protein
MRTNAPEKKLPRSLDMSGIAFAFNKKDLYGNFPRQEIEMMSFGRR